MHFPKIKVLISVKITSFFFIVYSSVFSFGLFVCFFAGFSFYKISHLFCLILEHIGTYFP